MMRLRFRLTHTTLASMILLGGIGLTPLIDGMIFKSRYYEFIEILNKEDRIKAQIIEYHQGWFSSSAKVNISFQDNGSTSGNLLSQFDYIIEADISHGPIVYRHMKNQIGFGYADINSRIRFARATNHLRTEGITQLDTLAKFSGHWHAQLHIPGLSVSFVNNDQLHWDGLDADLEIKIKNDLIKKIDIKANFKKLSFDSAGRNSLVKRVRIDPVAYQSQTVHQKEGLWAGSIIISSPNMVMENSDGERVMIEESNINGQYGITSDICYNAYLAINANTLTLPMKILSTLKNVHIKFSISNFKIAGLIQYALLLISEPQAFAIDHDSLSTLLAEAVMPNSMISHDFTSKTPLGNITSHAEITWPATVPLPKDWNDIANKSLTTISLRGSYDFIINAVSDYNWKVIASIVEQIKTKKTITTPNPPIPPNDKSISTTESMTPKELVNEMLLAGYIRKEGNDYTTTMTLVKNTWRMNGWVIKEKTGITP